MSARAQSLRPPGLLLRLEPVLAIALTATIALATATTIVISAAVDESGLVVAGALVATLCLTPAIVGTAILLRRPGHVIGRLLIAQALAITSIALADRYALYSLIEHPGSLPGGRWAQVWSANSWPVLFAGFAAIAFVMPDGHFMSDAWRRRGLVCGAIFVALMAVLIPAPGKFEEPFQNVDSPIPQLPEPFGLAIWLLVCAAFGALITSALAVRARLRQATETERLQLLWFAQAALLVPLAVAACLAGAVLNGGAETVTGVATAIAGIAVPLSIGASVLRHNLFDIELVLSRTLVYSALTLGVIAVYFATVALAGSLIDSRGTAGLIAVGAVAVGIEPLRVRLQARAERLVYGDRRAPHVALRRLSDRLQVTLAPDDVVQTVVDSVAEALRLPYVAVELERDRGTEVAAAHGEPGRGTLERLPLTYSGETVGRLVVQVPPGRELARADRALLGDLAGHAGVAVHAVRLTADLQRSRERLVTAREEERRRLRRDLHDGLGPDLAAIALRLDTAHSMAGSEPVADLLATLREETRDAIAGVRRIVDELRPPALDELGLVSALTEYTARLSAPGHDGGLVVRFHGPDRTPPLPAAIEVAAYRIALEAMTNAARHAGARTCDVRIALNGGLELEVADDGAGLPADLVAGVGLGSMRERAAEVGGACTVAPRPGGGTLVSAVLPLERA